MAPAKGDKGLRESERHVRQGPGVCRECPTAYPATSPPLPTRAGARCPCVALEGKAIVLRHWLMLSEVVIIVCRHRQASGRLTPPPLRTPPTPHPAVSYCGAHLGRSIRGAPRDRPSSKHEVARWRGGGRLFERRRGAEALRRDCGDGLTTLKPSSSSPAKWGAHG